MSLASACAEYSLAAASTVFSTSSADASIAIWFRPDSIRASSWARVANVSSTFSSQPSKALRWFSAQMIPAFSIGNCDSVVSAQPGKDSALWTTECRNYSSALLAGLRELLPSLESIYKISTLTLNSRCRKRGPQQSRRTIFAGLATK